LYKKSGGINLISEKNRLKKSEDLVWRVINGETVIMTADGREIHNLNRVASAIWGLSDGTKNINEIVSLICERFNVPFEIARRDVIEFGSQLQDKKLLEIS